MTTADAWKRQLQSWKKLADGTITLRCSIDPPLNEEDVYDQIHMSNNGVIRIVSPSRDKRFNANRIQQIIPRAFNNMLRITYRNTNGTSPCYYILLSRTGKMVIRSCSSRKEFDSLIPKIQEVFLSCGYTLRDIRDVETHFVEKG